LSHKTLGFFNIVGLPECVTYPYNQNEMIGKVKYCWENRVKIRTHLLKHMPKVQQLARDGFDELKNIMK
jgi:hypothetical protein